METLLVFSWARTGCLDPHDIVTCMLINREWRDTVYSVRTSLLQASLRRRLGPLIDCTPALSETFADIVIRSYLRAPALIRAAAAVELVCTMTKGDTYRPILQDFENDTIWSMPVVPAERDGQRITHTMIVLSAIMTRAVMLYDFGEWDVYGENRPDVRLWTMFALFRFVGIAFSHNVAHFAFGGEITNVLLTYAIHSIGMLTVMVQRDNNRRLHRRVRWLLFRVRRKLERAAAASATADTRLF